MEDVSRVQDRRQDVVVEYQRSGIADEKNIFLLWVKVSNQSHKRTDQV